MKATQKLAALREAMKAAELDAYLVPSSDPHQSEYTADHWKSREWLSGFTGSAATLVITAQAADLWTDSRYFIQAEKELKGSGFTLHKQGASGSLDYIDWLIGNLPEGSTVGCDGRLFSVQQIRYFQRVLDPEDLHLNYDHDLIQSIWTKRPGLPQAPVFEHEQHFAGRSRQEKLHQVRREMEQLEMQYYLISALDDIAWLLNLRGGDIEYNPVFIAHLIVSLDDCLLFVDESRFSPKLKKLLEEEEIIIKPYGQEVEFIQTLKERQFLLTDLSSTSIYHYKAIPDGLAYPGRNIVQALKAVKNNVEIAHLRQTMRKDGIALLKLFRWLESDLQQRTVTEYELGEQLKSFRAEQAHYQGESFGAIVGYNGNGAIVHYRPDPKSSASIRRAGILLLDSGGQYLDGTTDITRTLALGRPTDEQKEHFTLVLKGHIALATIQFPAGTRGGQLDILARMPLWKAGLNYGHGTGHGVGFFLNVHEPPQGFAPNPSGSRGSAMLKAGMVTSNEPGFYWENNYGIRIENLLLCVEGEKTDFGQFLRFETLTLFPIDRKLVDPKLLTKEEKEWLNDYNLRVFEELSPLADPEEANWLREHCMPVL